jgi:RNA polymerase sigma-70 factor (ECF subfamily)
MNPFLRSPIASSTAFSSLFETNRTPVFKYIYGLTGGPREKVEDLAAETFLRAWKARRSYKGGQDQATGWLIRIARNLVIDDFRREISRPVPVTLTDIPGLEQHASDLPEKAAQQNEEHHRLQVLLDQLQYGQREILVLRYMLGWRVAEIAHHLEMNENTVSVTIQRVLARLRNQWVQSEWNGLDAGMTIKEETP